jgi:hypothetical protein
MVVIEMEPEPEPEPSPPTRPSPPVPEEQVSPEAAGEAAGPSSPPAPKEQAAAAAGGEATRAEEGEEEAFEDALTDEQLREVGRERPRPKIPAFLSSVFATVVLKSGVQLL